ncbi:MAG: hypothetical protein ACRYHQ_05360, partial [Janthinobacterium lividum]
RDEFVDGYMARSKIAADRRAADGFTVRGRPNRVAVPCACGDKGCPGWAMIEGDPERISEYAEIYGPGGWAAA